MSQKQLAFPQTMQQATRQQRLSQVNFTGMNVDDEACNVGAGEVVKLVNLLAFGNELDGRTGSEKICNIGLPVLLEETDLSEVPPPVVFVGSKVGTAVSVPYLSERLTNGDYFQWSDGILDQVTQLTGSGFTSLFSETRAEDVDCRLVLQPFGAYYHDKSKRIYVHLGTELHVISTVDFAAYEKVLFVGNVGQGLTRSQTRFRPSDSDVLALNEHGLYRIVTEIATNPAIFHHYFQMNAENPSQAFDEVEQTEVLTFGRQAIYSLSRIIGGNFNDGRLGTGNLLLQESSPVSPDPTTRRDTAKVFTALPVGLGSELSYTLTSKDNPTTHISLNPAIWTALLATAGFTVKFSGRTAVIRPIFDASMTTMFTIADAIQLALRSEFPKASCIYYITAGGNPVFEFSPGEGGTIDIVTAGNYIGGPPLGSAIDITASGTDYLFMNSGNGVMATDQAKAPVNYNSALVPDDGAAFTHITLWTTTDNGPAGVALNNLTEKLIWNKDYPIIRPGSGELYNTKLALGTFYQADVGSLIRFFDGTEKKITRLTDGASTEVFTETSANGEVDVSAAADIIGPYAIGANKVGLATQTGQTLTIENLPGTVDGVPTASPYSFESSDVGKIIFVGNANGSLRHITRYIASDTVIVQEAGNFSNQAIGWDYKVVTATRSIRDTITDKILIQRGKDDDFVLQTRYYEPLPSTLIGDIVNNFLVVAPDNSTIMYYCAVPLGKKNRLGYHHPGWQKDDNTEDVITYIKRYADRIICFCRRSTYGTSTATISSMDEPTIGEKIFLLPHLSLVDNIGLVHTGSLQDIGIGQSIMITHEPAVRAFDGRQFGTKDLSAGAVYSYISTLARIVFSSYDAVGGYRIYGTLQETEIGANRINPETGICLQLALDADQGSGWSVQGGPKMVMPMPMTEGMLIQNEKGYLIQAMLDERTGKLYNISTYEGPEGSGLEEVWTDKDATEIQCQVIMREDKGNPESEQLEFLASHIYLRPDPSSVDDDGNPKYRTGQQVLCRIYNDGRVIYTAQTLNIPIPGDVSFDRKSQGPRIQLEFILSCSQVIIIGMDRIYASRDRAGNQAIASRSTTEIEYQRQYAQQILWLSRGRQPTLNRSIGNVAGGGSVVRVPGPDGQSNSAFQLANVLEPVEVETYQDLTGDFTIQFGYKQ